MKIKTLLSIVAISSVVSFVNAATVSVVDGDGNDFGRTSGFAIDFDATTGLSADWSPDLSEGQQYSLDYVTVYRGDTATLDQDLYLGVYTSLTGGTTLSGFLGVSSNTNNFSADTANTTMTWNFSGINVTPELNPGDGNDILYFVYQSGTDALSDANTYAEGETGVRRLDGDTGSFSDDLAAIIHGNGTQGRYDVRAPEYEASLTQVPEPATASFTVLGLAACLLRKKR